MLFLQVAKCGKMDRHNILASAKVVTILFVIGTLFVTSCAQPQDDINSRNGTVTSEAAGDEAAIPSGKCVADTRVSTLRCVSVSLDVLQATLGKLDKSLDDSLNRLDVSRGHDLARINSLAEARTQRLEFTSIAIINSGLEELGSNAFAGFNTGMIEAVDLSWNRLEAFPEVVLTLSKLRLLDLSHNQIYALPPGSSFNSLNALATLKLNGNL